MFTKIGEQIFYEDVTPGAAKNTNDPRGETIYLSFADGDNQEIHLFPMPVNKIEQYFNLVRQTAAGQQIEIPGGNSGPRPGE